MELLTPETMKILGNNKDKTTNNENGEKVPHSEIAKVVLVQCNNFSNGYQQDSRAFVHLFLVNHLVNY